MSKYSRLEMIDFLNGRMRPLKWDEWQMVTWEKVDKWCDLLGFGSRLTKHAPDVVESAASVSISPASEVSASEAESTPATTQVM